MMSSQIKVCGECGVPEPIYRFHRWTNDGRLLTRDGRQRLIIVEKDFLAQLFGTLEGELAAKAFGFLREAKAFDAKCYVQSLGGLRLRWARRLRPLRRRILYELTDFLRVLGLARLEVLEYQAEGKAHFRCYQCYQRDFLLGDLLGGYLMLHGYPFRHRFEEGEGFFDVIIEPDPTREDPTARFEYQAEEPLEGYISYKLCPRCGTPFPVSFFRWDLEQGTVMDTRSGREVLFIDIMGINLTVSALCAGGEEGLEDLLAENSRKLVDGIVPMLRWKHRRPEEQVRDLFFMAFRGMGNPIFTEPVEGGVRVRIENPFNYPLAAGIVASFISRGRESDFSWKRESPGRLEVTVKLEGR